MIGLELARPWVLWGLLLGVPILLFHLYARRRQRIIVPFVGLLSEALGPARPRSRFHRLREALSLLLRLAALACLVLALGGLRPAKAAKPPVDLMIVVDADVTTGAIEASLMPRLVEGLELAEAHVLAHAEGRVGVVLAADPLVVLAPLDEDRAPVVRALQALRARVAGRPRKPGERVLAVPARTRTDMDAAVRAAGAAVTARGPGRVVAITARPVAQVELPGSTLEIVGAGQTRVDQGFDDLTITSSPTGGYTVHVHVHSESEALVTRQVVATVGPTQVLDIEIEIDPESGGEAFFAADPGPSEGAWLTVRLGGNDALALNDRVDAWLGPRERPSVLLVEGARPRAFTALVMQELGDAIDLESSGRVKADDLAAANLLDVMIVDGVALPEGALRPGAWIFLAPLLGALPFETGAPLEAPLVWRTEAHHPLVRWLDFTGAEVAQGIPVSGPRLRPLAFADGQAVIAEGERDGVRYIVFGLDPEASYLTVQAALPLFLRRAVARLARSRVLPLQPFYRAGAPLRPRVPLQGGPRARLLRLTEGDARPLSAHLGGEATVRVDPLGAVFRVPPGAHGAYRLEVPPGASRAGEIMGRTGFVDFDPERRITPVRAPGVPPATRAAAVADHDTWRHGLILLAVLLLALDLLVLRRARRPVLVGRASA